MLKEIIGERIKEIRLIKGMTQEELSLKAKVNRSYLVRVENGSRNITISNLEKIIIALDEPYHSFFQLKISS